MPATTGTRSTVTGAAHSAATSRSAGRAAAQGVDTGARLLTQAGEPNPPPQPMDAQERLQHIRLDVTRIQHTLEIFRHVSKDDIDVAPSTAAIDDAFAHLGAEVPNWIATAKATKKKKDRGAKMNDARREGVSAMLAKVTAAIASATSDEKKEKKSSKAGGPITYPGVKRHLLEKIRVSLADMELLLTPEAESKEVVLSRQGQADVLLRDAVAHYVEDIDEFFTTRLPAFLDETRADVAVQSAAMPAGTDVPTANGRLPLVSVYIKDVVVGMQSPTFAVRPVLEHLKRFVEEVRARITAEVTVVKGVMGQRPERRTAEDHHLLQMQLAEMDAVDAAAREALEATNRLRTQWDEEEQRILQHAIGGQDQESLKMGKKLRARAVCEQATSLSQRLGRVAMAFVSPQYCRRRGLTYGNACSARVGVRLHDPVTSRVQEVLNLSSATVRNDGNTRIDDELLPSGDDLWVPFDKFPEVVGGARCVLRDATIAERQAALEEQRDCGGYYVINGGERIARALLMQRSNVPLNIYRDRFAAAGPNFSPKAVVMRCKRRSHLTTVNYFYYVNTGEVVFSFARRLVWHIPVALLMLACKTISPLALYNLLTAGVEDDAARARVEAFLQSHRSKSYSDCTDMVQYLAVIGRMFRSYQQASLVHFIPELGRGTQPHCDAWYGLYMIRRHLLPHLNASETDAEGNVTAVPTPDALQDGEVDPQWPGPAIRREMEEKFDVLVEILRQLHGFVSEETEHQGNDNPAFQEVFGPSQLLVAAFETCAMSFNKVLAYRLANNLKGSFLANFFSKPKDPTILKQLKGHLDHAMPRAEALTTLHKLLTTGNFKLDREEDFFMPQNTGWIVMAEHLNFFRFFEQLRTLHRGKKISDMRSSEVRKYPSEAFGFLCMVHSPDGEDCGIVNFMSSSMIVAPKSDTAVPAAVHKLLAKFSNVMSPTDGAIAGRAAALPVWLDGRVIAYVAESAAADVTAAIRAAKLAVNGAAVLRSPFYLTEVVHVPKHKKTPPGLFIFTDSCRMMRPVQDLATGKVLNVGSWEHIWLDIAAVPSDLLDAKRDIGKKYSHIEISGSHLISLTSNTIPFFEHNCSPRNLFQCGLSKQSSGTQIQGAAWRKEAKLFRTLTPQRYIVRTLPMDEYGLDEFSLGMNAVVAVLAYTGYDMDDAVIINQSSVDRGMLDAMITVAKVVDLTEQKTSGPNAGTVVFNNLTVDGARFDGTLDDNGLPYKRKPAGVTTMHHDHSQPSVLNDTAVYCTARRFTREDPARPGHELYEYQKHDVKRWRHFDKGENAWIHNVVPLKYDGPDVVQAMIVFRIPRHPMVGDKFSSRHGQKGTLPLHIRTHDLPFTSRGVTPDVLINPHAFPSRMTVGMVLEMVAGKLGSVQGRFIDNSAWSLVDETPVAAEDIGLALVKAGYARYGRESLYCGLTGDLMEADVFTGVCGYQRLRHQVNDKWQARARTDHGHRAVTKTGQPVKGRKRHGGVRVGEMERDGLLSHGIADVVQDRLLHVSDKTKAYICTRCGGMVGIYEQRTSRFNTRKMCSFCGQKDDDGGFLGRPSAATRDTVQLIDIPQVLRLWAAELTGVGVRVAFDVSQHQ